MYNPTQLQPVYRPHTERSSTDNKQLIELQPVYIPNNIGRSIKCVYLHIPSMSGFLFDQYMCIVATGVKAQARAKKALLVNDLTGDSLLNRLKMQISKEVQKINYIDISITNSDIISYFMRPKYIPYKGLRCLIPLDSEVVKMEKCEKHAFFKKCICSIFFSPVNNKRLEDPAKKYIDSVFTSSLCKFDEMYRITSNYFKLLIIDLCNDYNNADICDLIFKKKIIFELKGSMAIKKYLLMFYPERTNEINANFSNGDNDTSILIDPDLPNFDYIHKKVCRFIYSRMNIYVDRLFADIKPYCDELIKKGICINDILFYPNYCNSAGFEGKIIGNNLEIVYTDELKIRVQMNLLKFTDNVKCIHNFYLLRYKLPMKFSLIINGQQKDIISHAELLDISVPNKNECKLRMAMSEVNNMPIVEYINL